MKDKIDRAIKNKELFFIGKKLPDDFYSAFIEWKSLADETSDPKALYNLAYCYRHGEGTESNIQLAANTYKKSFSLGVKEAAYQLYSIYGKMQLEYKIGIFLKDSSPEIAKTYRDRTLKLLELLNEFTEKGLMDFENKKKALQTLIVVINLHISYLSNHDDFKNECIMLSRQGYLWAENLAYASECNVVSVQNYTAKRNLHETIRNGNTVFVKGEKFYSLDTDFYFNNVTDHTIIIEQGGKKTVIQPKQRAAFQYGRYEPPTQTKNTNNPPFFSKGYVYIDIVKLPEINNELGFSSAVDTLTLELSASNEKNIKEIPVSAFNKLGIFILIAFAIVLAMILTK